ncbi:MAG: glycoside hydrolase family protein [Acidimicrobiales bacterium]
MGEHARPTGSSPVAKRSAALVATVALCLLTACGSAGAGPVKSPRSASASGPVSGPITPAALASGAGHSCIVGGPRRVKVDWSRLSNPILSSPIAGVKDPALIWAAGRWHMIFSYVTYDRALPGGIYWDIATSTSSNLRHWSPITPWPRQPGVLGVASPDITREASGQFVVTYQSDPGASGPRHVQSRLFYRTSGNLDSWSAPHPLARGLAPSPQDRMIDGALIETGHDLMVGFKYSSPTQPAAFEIARSTSGSLSGPWQLVGRPNIQVVGGTIENYEFFTVGGTWHLVATSNNLDQPWIFTLAGDPSTPSGWLDWTGGAELALPSQAFNSGPGISGIGYEHANSIFLCDASTLPGHYVYAVYAGSTELSAFDGWGHAKLGVARSTDLVHWAAPPG